MDFYLNAGNLIYADESTVRHRQNSVISSGKIVSKKFCIACVDYLPGVDLSSDCSPAKCEDFCKTFSFSSPKIMSGFKFNIPNKYYKILLFLTTRTNTMMLLTVYEYL